MVTGAVCVIQSNRMNFGSFKRQYLNFFPAASDLYIEHSCKGPLKPASLQNDLCS